MSGEELENLLLELCSRFGDKQIELIRQACTMAKSILAGKTKENGEPAYNHALRVAIIAIEEISLKHTSIIAAILHECTSTNESSTDSIEEKFGEQASYIIKEMLKISNLQKERLQLNSENYISLLLTITKDVRVILLKLADTLDKIRNIKLYPADRQLKIAQTARLLYGPIAHRLGLYHIKTELEDISLKYIKPDTYYNIARALNETKSKREQYITDFNKSINEILKAKGYTYEIKGRPKSVNSIYGKIKKQNVDISEIYDLFAIRIILDNIPTEKEKEECWNVYSIITNIYTPNPTRLRDWISTPRPSGYESLHTTVAGPDGHWVEVQIRTRRMDDIAEKGHAAHWKYKSTGIDESQDNWLSSIRNILEHQDDGTYDDDSNLHNNNTQASHIFAFTPQGDIVKLRNGATVLDFAYSIHSNLGNTCTGARIDGKIVSFRQAINNGDTVEILTSKTQKPNIEWLNIVASPRIKNRIKRALNEDIFRHAEIGKEMLERKVSQLKLNISDQTILQMLTHFKYNHALDFYQDIADEKIDIRDVKDYLQNAQTDEIRTTTEHEGTNSDYNTRNTDSDDSLIIDRDLVNVDYKLARCCHPIPGDKIFGFVTVDRGIQIHRIGCPNAKDLFERYPYRIVKARWNDNEKESVFKTDITVTGIDKNGVVNHITEVISKSENVNLRSLSVNSKDGVFKAYISIFTTSTDQLDTLLTKIERIKDVIRAERER